MSQFELPGWYVEDETPAVAPVYVSEPESDEERRRRHVQRARWRLIMASGFVVVTGFAAALNIWSLSVPGVILLPWMITTPFLALVAVVCAVDLLVRIPEVPLARRRLVRLHLELVRSLSGRQRTGRDLRGADQGVRLALA